MKQVEVIVNVTWEIDGNNITQIFTFNDKYYIHSPSYIIHQKFEDKIIENCISHWSGISFVDMERRSEEIIIKYRSYNNFDISGLKPKFYKVVSTLPDYEGCEFCRYYKKKNNYFVCSFQDDKSIHNPKKNCRFFKQKKLNLT